jgi:hypothetical protein
MADSLRSYGFASSRHAQIPFSQAAFRIIRFTERNDLCCFQVKMERSIFRFSTTNFPIIILCIDYYKFKENNEKEIKLIYFSFEKKQSILVELRCLNLPLR